MRRTRSKPRECEFLWFGLQHRGRGKDPLERSYDWLDTLPRSSLRDDAWQDVLRGSEYAKAMEAAIHPKTVGGVVGGRL